MAVAENLSFFHTALSHTFVTKISWKQRFYIKKSLILRNLSEKMVRAQCGNSKNFSPWLFMKNFVKVTFLLKIYAVNWFHESWGKFPAFPHCTVERKFSQFLHTCTIFCCGNYGCLSSLDKNVVIFAFSACSTMIQMIFEQVQICN